MIFRWTKSDKQCFKRALSFTLPFLKIGPSDLYREKYNIFKNIFFNIGNGTN